jgi:phage/plasmid-associated DNA primase
MLAVGTVCQQVYESYVEFCRTNGFMVKKSTTFSGEIGAYCEHKQRRLQGSKNYYYTLKQEFGNKYISREEN